MIVFRTNCNGTLGHLARCRHLALALRQLGHSCVLLVDHLDDRLPDAWSDGPNLCGLYDASASHFDTQADDVARVFHWLGDQPVSLIVVDDYRLDSEWEDAFRSHGYVVAAIDDLQRSHRVDLLIEPGLVPAVDHRAHPSDMEWLQGPEYLLLDPAFAGKEARRDHGLARVLMSLGGGGDIDLLAAIVEALIEHRADFPSTGIEVCAVIGPMGLHTDRLKALARENPTLLKIVQSPPSLLPLMQRSDLFVGAAGTALFELSALKLPATTFSIADNQVNDLTELERLGHPFHINDFTLEQASAMGRWIVTALRQRERLRQLRATAAVLVDGYGVQRVASRIDRRIRGRVTGAVARVPAHPENPSDGRAADDDWIELARGYRIRAVRDTDVNHYLDSRNLAANRGNMTTTKPLARLDHYGWWFTAKRASFLLEIDRVPALYIWHEKVAVSGRDVMVGGWFVCRDDVGTLPVMAALAWQLAYTDTNFPGIPWIAVIKRSNRFVFSMNRRENFHEVEPGSEEFDIAMSFFRGACETDFHVLWRAGASG